MKKYCLYSLFLSFFPLVHWLLRLFRDKKEFWAVYLWEQVVNT